MTRFGGEPSRHKTANPTGPEFQHAHGLVDDHNKSHCNW